MASLGARTRYDSIHGRIETSWKLNGKQLALEVTVPANTTATVCVPATGAASIRESDEPVAQVTGVKFLRQEEGKVFFEVGSGTYKFTGEASL